MTGASFGRDGLEVDALVTDRYLEALLGSRGSAAAGIPATFALTGPADQIRSAADRLSRDLPRLHPSFLFEEALAARLAEVAARLRLPAAAGVEGFVVPLPVRVSADDDDPADGRVGFGRPWLVGGALTSAALSLAGAAYVAWRLNRPAGGPMVRAARAVARTRPV